MRIGLDFDNTIVDYDRLFHRVALEEGLIPSDLPVNKIAVRDYLRAIQKEPRWTEMQGTVYGARMAEAVAYPGVIQFIQRAQAQGHTLAIISHKTKHNYLGPQYDLHAAARAWIEANLSLGKTPFIPENQVFFELTKEEKLARVKAFACEVFIDDLPEILLAPSFPNQTARLLFDPQAHYSKSKVQALEKFASWAALEKHLGLSC